MNKSSFLIIVAIGVLSITSGSYLAITVADFSTYFSGIVIGIALIGAAIINKNKKIGLRILSNE